MTSLASSVGRRLRFLLPAQLTIEAVMQVRAGIMVSMGFIATGNTAEELPPALYDSLSGANGEPLTLRAAAGAIL
jgi:hypothetical protein